MNVGFIRLDGFDVDWWLRFGEVEGEWVFFEVIFEDVSFLMRLVPMLECVS